MNARQLLAIVLCCMIGRSSFGATYYISKSSGNDSNTATQAQSKSTPWQHLPGQFGCGTGCSSVTNTFGTSPSPGGGYAPVAGDRFILKGGDTWGASDLGMYFQWGGSSGSPIYIGVDQTWFTGGSWTRPIWDCGGTACGYAAGGESAFIEVPANWVTVDNIEMKGLHTTSGQQYAFVEFDGQNQVYEHLYLHGWSHAVSGDSDTAIAFSGNASSRSVQGTCIHDSVIDGSDTSEDMLVAFFSTIPCAYNNYINHVSNGMEASADNVHDSTMLTIDPSFTSGAHQNSWFIFGPAYATVQLFYNNRTDQGLACGGGCVKIWLNGNNTNSATLYAFNNVTNGAQPGNDFNVAGHNAVPYGTIIPFNNTEECGNDSSATGCDGPVCSGGQCSPSGTASWDNNHWIMSSTFQYFYYPNFMTTVGARELAQTVSAAAASGYTSGSTYAFQPTSGAGATVGKGDNLQSICSTINGIDAVAGPACQADTTYGVAVSGNVVTGPARTALARPLISAWDIGAFQFQSGVFVGSARGGNVSFGENLVAQ